MDSIGSSSSAVLPLEPVLSYANELDDLDIARQSQLYTFLDHPRHAAVLTCLDAKGLQVLSSGGGLRLFKHRLRPVVYVHVIGRLIGIEEKEKRIIWLVDDGTDVIAVYHNHKEEVVASSSPRLSPRTPRSSLKGKTKARENHLYDIPPEYQLPPLPALPRSSKKATKVVKVIKDYSTLFKIGNLLSIVGRAEVWKWSNERVICVDEVLTQDLDRERAERYGTIRRATKSDQEPKHLLQALKLSATEYSRPFQIPENASYSRPAEARQCLRVLQDSQIEKTITGQTQRNLGVIGDAPALAQQRRSLRVMEDSSEDSAKIAKRRTLGVPRRLIQASNETAKMIERQAACKKYPERSRETQEDAPASKEHLQSSQTSIISVQTTGSPRHRRQLRKYTKLSDSSMTESTFRVYVEKHIVDFCSSSTTTLDLSYILRTPTGKKRKGPGQKRSGESLEPAAFTLKYLMRIKELRDHAQRTVEVATRKREEKRRRKAALSRSSIPLIVSNERIEDKVRRLYECILQAMMMDGIIVLASPSVIPHSPFDGNCHSIADTMEILSSSSETERESVTRKRNLKDLDAYQVVTPNLLALPVHQITSTSTNAHLTSTQILSKLQMMDDRWHYIREESIQECITLLRQAAATD